MDLYDTGLPEAVHWCIWEALSSSDQGVAQKPVLYTSVLLESGPYITEYIENIAMLVGTVLFMVINYIGQKFFAFKKH